jgi:hypothetical protein
VAGGGSSVDGGTGSSAVGGSSAAGGGEDGSSSAPGGGSAEGGGSADGGGVDGSSAAGGVSSDAGGSLSVGGEGASVLVLDVSLAPKSGGVEDAGWDGVSSEVEDDSSPREGDIESSVEEDAESVEAVLLDWPAAVPTRSPGEGIAELAAASPWRMLCSTVFSPSVPSSAWTWSSTCSITSPATRPTASSGLAIGLSESGASHESRETVTTAATTTPAPARA